MRRFIGMGLGLALVAALAWAQVGDRAGSGGGARAGMQALTGRVISVTATGARQGTLMVQSEGAPGATGTTAGATGTTAGA
ncbi:MAG: hypothetical protein JO112_10945, partial [Planctomycetes bacterium]|nr:hypothetical protein [Planctomycetota bacterium]